LLRLRLDQTFSYKATTTAFLWQNVNFSYVFSVTRSNRPRLCIWISK